MPQENLTVNVNLNEDQKAILKSAFPEIDDIEKISSILCQFASEEFIDLIGGRVRYLSLTHQYIEWIEKIYELLLPEEEFTYMKISNDFNFPPGTSSYISRVLRSRQNTIIHKKSITNLKRIISETIAEYDILTQEEKPHHKVRILRLTMREHEILVMVVEKMLFKKQISESPHTTSKLKELINITYDVEVLRKILPEL